MDQGAKLKISQVAVSKSIPVEMHLKGGIKKKIELYIIITHNIHPFQNNAIIYNQNTRV